MIFDFVIAYMPIVVGLGYSLVPKLILSSIGNVDFKNHVGSQIW